MVEITVRLGDRNLGRYCEVEKCLVESGRVSE